MAEERILEEIYAAHRYLSDLESVPRDYGTGEALYASEIHTVVAVHRDPECNLTTLASALGVSSAAASKFTAKLVRRGYLSKDKAPGNRRDVRFRVTEKGRVAAEGHSQFELGTFGVLRRIEGELSRDDRAVIAGFFDKLLSSVR